MIRSPGSDARTSRNTQGRRWIDLSATEFIHIFADLSIAGIANAVSDTLDAPFQSVPGSDYYAAVYRGDSLRIMAGEDGIVLTVDPVASRGVEALPIALAIYEKLAEATRWGLEIDLAEETLVRPSIES